MPQLGTLAFAQDERGVVRIEIRTKLDPIRQQVSSHRVMVPPSLRIGCK